MTGKAYNVNPSSDVLALAKALIERPSLTPDDGGCMDLIEPRLVAAGMAMESLDFGDVRNLLAVHGAGPPHVMLLGHTDVVPPGPLEEWTSPPFEPSVRDGMLYGRGAADMKGSVAALVVAVQRFLAERADHAGTLSLLLTSDEEGPAEHGVRAVVPVLKKRRLLPDACLVGEPSSRERLGDVMRIGRRGSIQARLIIRGVQGHTAYAHPADNPVHRAGPLLAELGQLCYEDGDDDFPPTKLQISNLRAGTGAENVTPGQLEIRFNIRNNPHSPADVLKDRVEAIIEAHDPGPWCLDWRVSGEPFGPARGALPMAVVEACREVLGHSPEADTGGGTSDGRFLGPAGVSVVELGPVNRTIHQVDECVSVADLKRLPAVYQAVMNRLLAD
ncbi:succinyl-diaminopimelate desuccinylase [Wenzhouxiangella limi]|uniref:Succinyl-diaminopimelate desuccinylase n=1 Tax=Wenzhouxiangella limi TaxID=2707351 RepID=A0A845UZE4_9GAMM|nr:succinyl-diaminopimelate desuccinylase [Wenzhouxiangella limi]NDY96118.1 succinyl-diaminopimelate desuccinylase [Wenzhouxiangella limi]